MQKIKCKDQVIVLTGKDKGKTGTVLKIITSPDAKKVLVEGINMVKKHVKANPSEGKQGGIISQEAAIDISNVAIFNPNTGKADKVSFKVLDSENRKVRVFNSTGEVVDV